MLALREKIDEQNKQYKEQCESKGPRDITQEFVLRSKLRDLNNSCRVSVFYRVIMKSCKWQASVLF